MAGSSLPSSLLTQGGPSLLFSSSNQVSEAKCQLVVTPGKRSLVRCLAKKKISFVDQILDYIEGGPKLRKWYGAPELLPKDGSSSGEDDEAEEQEEDALDGNKDTVFVTDGDSDVGQEGFLSNVKSLKGVKHVVLLSQVRMHLHVDLFCIWKDHGLMKLQLSVYESSGGIEAMMNSKAKKLSEGDEKAVLSSNVPYTIIRTGKLENSPGGNLGFNFSTDAAAKGSLSKEDAARICIEALSVIPPTGLLFQVSNGEEAVSDWEGQLMKLMQRQNQKK
uniref:Uncharacterized protein n=1 Tax=Brassica campestris TaxID=3711 RepID=M4DHR8_BRACM